MKQRLLLSFSFLILLLLLVLLNAVSYVQKEKPPDNEVSPDRSTFNNGATGTSALYALVSESGYPVRRWHESPVDLRNGRERLDVFVVIGQLKGELTGVEIEGVLKWVADGGRLVLIDRSPLDQLKTTTANWWIRIEEHFNPRIYSVDPAEPREMTDETPAARAIQPSVMTHAANTVQPSLFASTLVIEPMASATPVDEKDRRYPSPPVTAPVRVTAPLPLISSTNGTMMITAPFGTGEIVFLTDPYIVSNGGIGLADNAQLALAIVSRGGGTIAFDEYHHGYGESSNRFLQFFAGTPIVGMFLQLVVLMAAVFYSQSRRFARPLPATEEDRLSKLEYISAMAQLQQRARAYDLAIENIYTSFRRKASRSLGLDTLHVTTADLARAIAERTGLDRLEVSGVLDTCEEAVRGEPTNSHETTALVTKLRQFEQKLGIRRSGAATR